MSLRRTAIFERRVLAPDHQRDAPALRNRRRNCEKRQMHSNCGRARALKAFERQLALDLGIDGIVDMIDAKPDQVIEVALADGGTAGRPPTNGEGFEP